MPRTSRPALTRREREIIDILYRLGQATAADVQDHMASAPSYSAVRALLRLLEERGHVKHKQDGPRYVYAPAVARDDARRSALAHVVRTFFEGSIEQAVAALVGAPHTKLTAEELDRIARMIARAKKEGR
jgi:predicted transcriptional regulator